MAALHLFGKSGADISFEKQGIRFDYDRSYAFLCTMKNVFNKGEKGFKKYREKSVGLFD